MPDKPKATLIAEIGNAVTRVTLVDTVAGETRLISQAEVASTTEPPFENAVIGILEAAARISELTERKLLQDDGTLLIPQNSENDGVSRVIALTSAAGMMGLVITAVASEVSARSALHASRATYTSVLQVVTLDDSAKSADSNDSTWIERQVQALVGLNPDVVLMTGGLDGGAVEALVRLAHIVGITALNVRVDRDGQQRHDVAARPVIFAGNSAAREQVIESLSGRAELTVVDNVRPTLEVEQLNPTRQALTKRYNEQVLPRLPGIGVLRRLTNRPLCTVAEASGLIARFIAKQYQRSTLMLDAGSAHTTAFLANGDLYSPVVMAGIGTGYGASAVLAERGLASIMRWLPFPISERDLTHWILNKMLRPHVLPTLREDVLIEHAITREALSLALEALWDEQPNAQYDFVMAGGGVLSHSPHPGLAALTILDALQPTLDQTELAVELHLDMLSLAPAAGALAFADSDGALSMIERDLLNNTPLATCIVALGDGRRDEVAVEAELTPVGEAPRRVTVKHGQIACLPLTPGEKGTLTLRPASGVRIGLNAPGKEVASQLAAISGSALGVIIDARGRPLRLPDEPLERQQLLWDWLVAMGVESGSLPYAAAEPLSDAAPSIPIPPLDTSDAAIPAAAPQPTASSLPQEASNELDSLAKLRQTVETPKKRGLFGRSKK
jgi:hypothetical protein